VGAGGSEGAEGEGGGDGGGVKGAALPAEPPRLAAHASGADLEALCRRALSQYGVRVLDNVDLSRLDGSAARGFVIARALMERGDARAFAMAREILSFLET